MPQQASLPELPVRLIALAVYLAACLFLAPIPWGMVWLGLGVVCGVGFMVADEYSLHRWYRDEKSPEFLVSRSPLFWLALMPLALMVMTSFGSFWAIGVVGSMMLFLLLEMVELRKQPPLFQQRFFQGTGVKVTESAINFILWGGAVFFLVVHLLAIL